MRTSIEEVFLDEEMMDEETTGFIPLIADGDDAFEFKKGENENISVLALRNMVLFPGVIMPVSLGRKKSLVAVKDAYKKNVLLGVFTQKDSNEENPKYNDLYHTGTVAQVIKILEMPDGSTSAILQGKKRIYLNEIFVEEPFFRGSVRIL